MVAHVHRGKLNLQMDFYFANNTIVIREHAFLCSCRGECCYWRRNTPTIKMFNSRELLSRDVTVMRGSVCVGSVHRAKICGFRSDTHLYYLLRRQSQVSHNFTFISQAHAVILKAWYILKVFLFSLKKTFFFS